MIAILSAPTNLGLRPPVPGVVPGTDKAPEALREAGLFARFAERGAIDAGVVLPSRYVDDDATRPRDMLRNQAAIVDHSRRLADRIERIWTAGHAPLVLGGDCSLLVGAGLALARRGRAGLVHVDGHTDFRHPGNSAVIGSLGGEDLAAAVGLHLDAVADLDGRRPYVEPARVAHIGHRADDEHVDEVRALLGAVLPAAAVGRDGPAAVAGAARAAAGDVYWLQVDVDVLDPPVMPAVDSPDTGGIEADQLVALLRALAPGAVGVSITIFDPDLDPDGRFARLLTDVLLDGLGEWQGQVLARGGGGR